MEAGCKVCRKGAFRPRHGLPSQSLWQTLGCKCDKPDMFGVSVVPDIDWQQGMCSKTRLRRQSGACPSRAFTIVAICVETSSQLVHSISIERHKPASPDLQVGQKSISLRMTSAGSRVGWTSIDVHRNKKRYCSS